MSTTKEKARIWFPLGILFLIVSSVGLATSIECALTDSAALMAKSALLSQTEAKDPYLSLPYPAQGQEQFEKDNNQLLISYAGNGSGGEHNFDQDIYFGGYDPVFLDSFSLKSGRLPKDSDEILLTSYFVSAPNTFAIHNEEDILERTLKLSGKEYTVIGVLDDGLKYQEGSPFSTQRLAHRAVYLNPSAFENEKHEVNYVVFKEPNQSQLENYLRKTEQAWHIDRMTPYVWLGALLGSFALITSVLCQSLFYKNEFELEAKERWKTHQEAHGRQRIARSAAVSAFASAVVALPIGFGLFFLANHYGAIHENVSFAPYPLQWAALVCIFLTAIVGSLLSLGVGFLLYRKKNPMLS